MGSTAFELACFVTETTSGTVPPKAREYASMLIASTVASAASGLAENSCQIMRQLELERGGRQDATMWFAQGAKVPLAAAGRVNALMSDSAASDDSDLRNMVHPGTTVAASSLAAAELTGASGGDILDAIVLGYEVAGRINTAVIPGLREKGYHGCIVATFGAAASAGRLLGLDSIKMTHALSLAASSVGGIMAAAKTSTSREYHAGLAVMLGMEAALAAGRGYLGEPTIFDAAEGFFHIYGEGPKAPQVQRMCADKSTWHILTNMAIKMVPGGHTLHAIAEAAVRAAREGDVSSGDVESITVSMPGVTKLIGPQYPEDLVGMIHSSAFFLSSAIVKKDFTWGQLSMSNLSDPSIRELLGKVQVGPPPRQDLERFCEGGIVSITVKSGRTYTSTVYAPSGYSLHGIDWADVERKYKSLLPLAGVSGERISSGWTLIRNFDTAPNASALTSLL
ncbi:MmgE/PrpD family protein [Rhizobium sp. PP-F2F-G48]|uniref:MmgE/PrpD family protein n=1 Tax=Rhizobium sp. PP-F2F-G48 TaxID=2135651 RepID=UPI001404C93A|nr:MmgE/PrpD family protein [Rhizobium sp. PP-F2F-G48]